MHRGKRLKNTDPCPLCTSLDYLPFHRDRMREYSRCPNCHLIFVNARWFLPASEEKRIYDQHQNNPQDSRYRQFLGRLFIPLHARLQKPAYGLDFGCGPGPTLSVMLEEAGHNVELYDHFYYNNPQALRKRYDFITATEVVEHLHQPWRELDILWNCLKQDGLLGIMTRLATDESHFADWHYKNDPTHVCFFSRQTFAWLSDRWQAHMEFVADDALIFHKTKL